MIGRELTHMRRMTMKLILHNFLSTFTTKQKTQTNSHRNKRSGMSMTSYSLYDLNVSFTQRSPPPLPLTFHIVWITSFRDVMLKNEKAKTNIKWSRAQLKNSLWKFFRQNERSWGKQSRINFWYTNIETKTTQQRVNITMIHLCDNCTNRNGKQSCHSTHSYS